MPKKRPRRLVSRSGFDYAVFVAVVTTICFALIATAGSAPQEKEVQIVAAEDSIEIPVPARAVARGERLNAIQFLSVRWPKSKLPGNFLRTPDALRNAYAATPLPAHLPVPLAALSEVALDLNAVAEAIPPSMRAITVKVDAESAVEGWARSGNFVDVILVRKSDGGLESLVIAENVKILSAGASSQPSGGETAAKTPNTVTLLVTQEDALRVKTAGNIGRLTFALRGAGDMTPALLTSYDQQRLYGPQAAHAPPAAYIGRARGPDGRTYVLAQNSRWLRSSEEIAGFPSEERNGK